MIIAVMQPYFLPYVGYWQLMDAADIFVALDDVNYIKKGYINRNSLLLNGQGHRFVIPLEKASQNRRIHELRLLFPPGRREALLKTIRAAYRRAPYFESGYPLVEQIVMSGEEGLAEYVGQSLALVRSWLGLQTKVVFSSSLEKDEDLKGQDRIIEICRLLNARTYVNPPGGRGLYRAADFARVGLDLKFLQPGRVEYQQFGGKFIPNLSVVDVIMFNPLERIRSFLKEYSLDD